MEDQDKHEKILSITSLHKKTHDFTTEYKRKAKILRFKISEFLRRIKDKAQRTSLQVTKLKSFKAAKAKMQVHLYKQFLLPIKEYLPISIHTPSKN